MAETKPHLFIGADHGGFGHKALLIEYLQAQGYQVEDCGNLVLDAADDYPQFALAVAEKVHALELTDTPSFGILLCRSGGGMVIAANKVMGIRAVAVQTEAEAVHARVHNNAQVVSFSADSLSPAQVQQLLGVFLTTPFTGEERHVRRLSQIAAYEESRS